ncbi:MAG: hypothetical protein ACM3S2_10840 [Ignavibacteriales bacterium]
MGTNKIILLVFFALIFVSTKMFAQAEYVPYNHPVYDYLERMNELHVIAGFNDFERPLSRRIIAKYLETVIENISNLDKTDRLMLADFSKEFEYELTGSVKNSTSLFGDSTYSFLSQNQKYIYLLADSAKATLFVNLLADFETIFENNRTAGNNEKASFLRWGGILRGTFLNKFGYYIKGTNGKLWGNKTVARTVNELKFNYKLNANPAFVTATDYFDNSEGYLTADFDLVRFKIGRDQKIVGYGPVKTILSDNTPQFDYLSLDMNYKIFSFSYFHGKLLGAATSQFDTLQGEIKKVDEKYMGYHRLGFNFSRHLSIGMGEMIIYAGRSLDLTYLNPFNFYKSAEHSNQDRDNSLLFLDISNNSLKGLKVSGSVLIDDIDFGKLGSGWYGNQLAYTLYARSSNLYNYYPVDLGFQYTRVEPYVYSHRITDNNYTNFGTGLTDPLKPNSDLFLFDINYRPHYRVNVSFEFRFSRHGANELNTDGTLKRNVGGDVQYGHRNSDPEKVTFLDGDMEYYRSITFSSVFEPIKNYFISGRVEYQHNSLQNSNIQKFLTAYLLINLSL